VVKYGTAVLQQQRHQLAEKADRCVGTADFERIVQMFGSIQLTAGVHFLWDVPNGEKRRWGSWRGQPPFLSSYRVWGAV